MPIEITTALIAFVGVILGIGVTFLLQLLQRRWSLDDQRRERRRGEWEELSNAYGRLGKVLAKIYINPKSIDEYEEEFIELFSDLNIHKLPIHDIELEKKDVVLVNKLEDLFAEGEIVDEEGIKYLLIDIQDAISDIQQRIKEHIEETYN